MRVPLARDPNVCGNWSAHSHAFLSLPPSLSWFLAWARAAVSMCWCVCVWEAMRLGTMLTLCGLSFCPAFVPPGAFLAADTTYSGQSIGNHDTCRMFLPLCGRIQKHSPKYAQMYAFSCLNNVTNKYERNITYFCFISFYLISPNSTEIVVKHMWLINMLQSNSFLFPCRQQGAALTEKAQKEPWVRHWCPW